MTRDEFIKQVEEGELVVLLTTGDGEPRDRLSPAIKVVGFREDKFEYMYPTSARGYVSTFYYRYVETVFV